MLQILLAPHNEAGVFALDQFKQNRKELIVETSLDYDAKRSSSDSLSDEAWRKAHPGEKLNRGNFLANDIWTNGLPPLVISWFNHAEWQSGMKQLFFSPKVLGVDSHGVKPAESFSCYMLALVGSAPKTIESVTLASIA